jgi:diguanylate cyclase (GGDEF)-like protein
MSATDGLTGIANRRHFDETLASEWSRIRRSGDMVARYGGEEFAIISYATGEENALAMADMICQAIAGLKLTHPYSPFGVLTVSVGVAVLAPGEEDSIIDLLKAADTALYRAKQLGRNRVELADTLTV